jgi:shikimate kinase
MLPREASAESRSAITVVSAFASGKGVTVGIDLPCRVTAILRNRRKGDTGIKISGGVPDPHNLVQTCVEKSVESLGAFLPKEQTIVLKVNSSIPTAVGLKSSSAVSVAVTRALFSLFGLDDSNPAITQKILRLSCEASIQSGASLTGAYDDAAAGLLGGLVFSDNLKFKLLRHEPLDDSLGSIVKILLPRKIKLTSSLDLSTYQSFRHRSSEAIGFAKKGMLIQAMFLNSIIHSVIHHYSLQPIVSSIVEGASASGITGKGPAVAALCPNNKMARRIERRWLEDLSDSKVITATVTAPTENGDV